MWFVSSAAPVPPHAQLVHTILNAPLPFDAINHLPDVCANLADYFLGSDDCPPVRLTFSGLEQDQRTIIDFTAIPNQARSREQRGEAVMMRIVKQLVPALQRNGADEQAALDAARHIVAQLGNQAFATLEQTAVQGVMENRMSGEPVSALHIALAPHGEVLLHKTTQWAGYVDDTGQIMGFGDNGPPVLKVDVVTSFWLERAAPSAPPAPDGTQGTRTVFSNVDGAKHFALHGRVQRCLLETPDAALKARLVPCTPTFIETLLYGLARVLGAAGIFIEPPLENLGWAATRPQLRTAPTVAPNVVPHTPAALPHIAARRFQGAHAGGAERDVAFALGEYCRSMASRLMTHSYSKVRVAASRLPADESERLMVQAERDGRFINQMRHAAGPNQSASQNALQVLKDSLKTSTGDCGEMALVTAALVQSQAKQFLSERGFEDADTRVDIYKAKTDGDHAFCVMTLKLNGFTYKVAIDPWADVSMLYDHYVDYVTTFPDNIYISAATTFGIDCGYSASINHPFFKWWAPFVLEKYSPPPGAAKPHAEWPDIGERTMQVMDDRSRISPMITRAGLLPIFG